MPHSRPRGRPAHPDQLTPAEWRVVEAVRHGLSNPSIARRLGVSPDAVKFHVANVLQKLGFASRAELRRWDGISRDSNLFVQEIKMDATVPIGAIGQIARGVTDIVAATAWYRDILGLEHLFSAGNMSFFDCAGVRLMLSQGDGAADSIIYFRVSDIRAAHATLQARGVTFISAPHLIHRHQDGTEEWMAFFNDNQGRPLGVMASVKKEDVLF